MESSSEVKEIVALVADDDRTTRSIHSKLLTRLGVSSWEVSNGKEAVDLCSSGKLFDVIFMDYNMPVMNGPQATRRLREMKVNSKIIGISAQSREHEIKEFTEAGIDVYQEKPLTQDKIKSILQDIKNNH